MNHCEDIKCDDPDCKDCCFHFEHDHGICLDCGADVLDTLISSIDFEE